VRAAARGVGKSLAIRFLFARRVRPATINKPLAPTMISKHDLERLLQREESGKPVLSVFLDMSVNSDNKRTHAIFLSQKKIQFTELSHGEGEPRDRELDQALDRVDSWLAEQFDEENRGVAIYTEIGGDWFEALQFPVPVQNRLVVNDRPFIGPLAEVIETYHHHGVVLLDREHVRILSVYLGTLLDEIEVKGEPWPSPHDVQAGGYSQKRYQRRKAEELKHFFKEFAKEVEEFVRRHRPDDLVILGTDSTVAKFREFLPDQLQERIVYTGAMWVDEPASKVVAELEPHLQAERERESKHLLQVLRERVRQDYLATAGFHGTLTALQEGKVETLVIAQDQEREGSRCPGCGFVFASEVATCPFDGTELKPGVNLVEEAVRIAQEQGADVEFVPGADMGDLRGIGALLRF
jgi:peptide chain release factor subunit 1